MVNSIPLEGLGVIDAVNWVFHNDMLVDSIDRVYFQVHRFDAALRYLDEFGLVNANVYCLLNTDIYYAIVNNGLLKLHEFGSHDVVDTLSSV